MKSWRNIFICVITFIVFIIGFDSYLTFNIENSYNKTINKVYGEPIKDQGTILQQTSLNKNDLLIFGSSELASYVRQNPKDFFPTQEFNYNVNAIGRAGVLDLEHALNINDLDFTNNKKVVYLLSFPWFTADSIDKGSFYANFSRNKFFHFMTDNAVSNEDKIYMATRVGNLANSESNTTSLDAWAYAKLCAKGSFAFDAIQIVSYPYLMFERTILNLKDKALSLRYLNNVQPYKSKNRKHTDWANEVKEAKQEGESYVHDKKFYFDDGFANYMSDKISALKDSEANTDLNNSLEYQDYEAFLKTCKRKGIKPLIIIQSVNGWYYDYIGIDKEKRQSVYARLKQMAQYYGFTAYDMADYEYVPYAYYDAFHLGWKGWLYVDQKITEYFNNGF